MHWGDKSYSDFNLETRFNLEFVFIPRVEFR